MAASVITWLAGTAEGWACRLKFIACFAATSIVAIPAQAQNGTWNGTGTPPVIWNNSANWTPAAGSTIGSSGPTGTATFDTTGVGQLSLNGAVSLSTIQIDAGSNSFSINLSGNTLTLNSSSGGIIDNSAATISFLNGVIAGSGGVQQLGAGALILSGADTYSGATTVNTGTLQVNGSIASAVTVNAGGTLSGTGTVGSTTISSGTLAPGTPGSPTGTLTVNGSLTLSDVANYVVTINGGNGNSTTNVTGSATVAGTFTAVAAAGTANSYTAANTYTVLSATGGISRTFLGLNISGSFGNLVPYLTYDTNSKTKNVNQVVMGMTGGTVWLGSTATSGAYDWSTTTNWVGGVVPTATGVTNEPATTVATFGGTTSAITVNSAASAGALLFTSGAAASTFYINTAGTLILNGAGIVNNSGYAPIFNVGPTAGSGTLLFENAATAGNAVITNNSGGATTFGISAGLETATAGTANITNISGGSTTFYADTSAGSATITNNTLGTTTFNGSSTAGAATIVTNNGGTTTFNGNSTGGNAIFITNGTGVVDFGGSSGPLVNGINTVNITVGAIEGMGTGAQIEIGGDTLTINAGTGSFAGVISGSGALDIAGGTTTLTGTNTYTGATVVNGGILAVNGSIATSSGVAVNSGGTLTGNGSVPGVTVAAGGTLAPGASGAGTLTVNGNLSLAGDYVVTITNANGVNTETAVIGTGNGAGLGGIFTAVGTGSGYSSSDTYNVLTTVAINGVSGTFSGLSISGGGFGNFVPYLTYTGNSVVLDLTAGNSWLGGGANNWSTGAWSGGSAPTGISTPATSVATFSSAAGTNTTINVNALNTTVGTMLFGSSAPASAFTFNINSGNSLILNGIGVVDNSGGGPNAPTFCVGGTSCAGGTGSGTLTFQNAATAGDAVITTNNGGMTTFANNSTGGSAEFSTASGGVVDFSKTLGPSNNDSITAGSIAGAGDYYLGTDTLTVGSNNLSTIVSGVISACGAAGTSCAAYAGAQITGGALTKVGSGTLTLSGVNTYSGATTISAGTLALSGTGSISNSTQVAIATGATFDVSAATASVSIASLADSAAGQAGMVNLGSQTLTITNGSSTFSGVIADGGSHGNLAVTGGVQTLAGVETYTGATTISGGTLNLTGVNSIADSSGVTIGTGGTLGLGLFTQAIPTITLNGGTVEGGLLSATKSGTTPTVIMSTGGTINGVGGLANVTALSSATATILSGTNTYSGTTTINSAATLAGGGINAFSPNSSVTDNGTIDLGSTNQTIGSLNGASATAVVTNLSNPTGLTGANAPVLTVENGGTFSGIIENGTLASVTNSTGLTVAGGNLTLLNGISTYTGATTVGLAPIASTPTVLATLTLSGTASIADSSLVTVNSGGTLMGNGTASSVTVNAGGTLTPGASGAGTLTVNGNLSLAGDYVVTITNANGVNTETAVIGTGNGAGLGGIFTAVGTGSGYSSSDTYNVLTTVAINGVSGTFSGLSISGGGFGNFVPYLTYTGNSVVLDLTAGNSWLGGGANNWSTGAWSGGSAPTGISTPATSVATFSSAAGTNTTINVNALNTTVGTMLFGSSAPASAFTFNINSGNSLILNGIGIDDNSSHPPVFNVGSSGSGNLQFQNAATAGDAIINVTSGSTQFSGNSSGGTAAFNTAAGGTVDFSGTLGPAGNGAISAGSINGSGNYELGANQVTLIGGSTPFNTTVSGIISNCANGCLGNSLGTANGSLVMDALGSTLTLSGQNTYSGGTTLTAGTLVVDANTTPVTAAVAATSTSSAIPASGILSSAIGTGMLTFNGGTLQAGSPTTATIAFTNGSSSISWSSNGLPAGTPVQFTTTGSLPTNFTAGQTYWVVTTGSNTIAVSTVPGGTPIVAGSAGSGTETGATAGFTVANAAQITAGNILGIGGTIDAAGQTFTLSGSIADATTSSGGALRIASTISGGTLVFSGLNTYSGPTIVGAGGTTVTLQGGAADAFSGYSAVTVNAHGTLDLGGYNQAIGGLSGSGIVTNSGQATGVAATLTVDGGGTFSGTIQNGSGTGGVTSLAVLGNGTVLTLLNLNNTNYYTGSTTIGSGTLALSGSSSLANSSGIAISSGGTFDISQTAGTSIATLSGQGNVALGGQTLTIANTTNASSAYSGVIADGGIGHDTGGSLIIQSGTQALSGANTFTGGTTVSSGATLQVGASGALGTSGTSTLTLNGGTLQAGANNLSFNNATMLGAGGGTFDSHGDTLTWAGAISGSSLTVADSVGGGTIVLSGANSYTGATTVNGGTLSVIGNIAGPGAVTVNSGGTLSGTGTITPTVTVASGGTLTPGSTGTPTGTLNIGGNLTFNSGATYAVTLNGLANSATNVTGTADLLTGATLTVGGTASSTSTTYTLLSAGTLSGTFSGLNITGNFGNDLPTVTYPGGGVVDLKLTAAGYIWTGATSSVWSNGANWTGGVPTGAQSIAAFQSATPPAITITAVTIAASASVGTMLFNGDAPAFTFTINTGQTFALTANGIVNQSTGTYPTFSVAGIMQFEGASSGGNAAFNVLSGGVVDFSTSTGNAALSGGSIQSNTPGAGSIYLGSNTVAFGSNNLSTTFSGVISRSGGILNKVGTGTLTLSGPNTYSGGTTLTAGILQVGANTNYVTPNTPSSGILNSPIGTGALTFNGGTFQAGANNLSFTNNVVVNAFGGTFDTHGNTLTWTPTATFSGTGPLTVADSIGGGMFEADGDMHTLSGVTVSGGTLSGIGVLPSVTVNGGTLSPGSAGNPTGPLTIDGNLTLTAASFYMVSINAAGTLNSQTNVSGTATVASGATLLLSSNSFGLGAPPVATKTYTLLTATGGVTGTLTTQAAYASAAGPVQINAITSNPNNITATFKPAQLSASSLPSGYASFVNTINALSNAGKLSNSYISLFNSPTTGAPGVSGQSNGGVTPTLAQMQTAFATTLLGPNMGSRAGVVTGAYGPVLGFAPETPQTPEEQAAYNAVTPQAPLDTLMRSLKTENSYSAWGSVYGGYSKIDGNTSVGSQTATTDGVGLAAGIDMRLGTDTVVGFALGGGGTSWGLSNNLGGGTSDIFQAGFYGSQRFGNAYLSGALAYAFDQFRVNRNVTSPAAANLTANFDGNGVTGRIEGGYRWGSEDIGLTPYVAGQFSALRTPSYSETTASGASGFALAYAAQTATNERAELGTWLDMTMHLEDERTMRLGLRVAYAHDWWSNNSLTANFTTLPTSSFSMTGVTPPTNIGLVSLLSEYRYNTHVSLGLKLDGELSTEGYSIAGTGTFRYSW